MKLTTLYAKKYWEITWNAWTEHGQDKWMSLTECKCERTAYGKAVFTKGK